MTQTVYAVERRDGERWTLVGDHVFGTREAAEQFEEEYVESDLRGTATTVDTRIRELGVRE